MKTLRIPASEASFGQALRWCREQRRMTLRQLGAAVGVTPVFLCDVEHDRRQVSNVAAYAKALDVELTELESRQGFTADLKDWLSTQPKLLKLLRDIRAGRATPLILRGGR